MHYLKVDRAFVGGRLRMRREGDYTADDKLKSDWLEDVRSNGRDLDVVYDDRQKVVDMWSREGVPCFQVAPGDF